MENFDFKPVKHHLKIDLNRTLLVQWDRLNSSKLFSISSRLALALYYFIFRSSDIIDVCTYM